MFVYMHIYICTPDWQTNKNMHSHFPSAIGGGRTGYNWNELGVPVLFLGRFTRSPGNPG